MLYLTGDVCFTDNHFDIGFGVGSSIEQGLNPFYNIKKGDGDCWIGNFECVASNQTIHSNYRKDSFRIDPSKIAHCQLFDYFGIANNHVMEHGADAYAEMIEKLKCICKDTFGSRAQKSITFNHRNKKVSITGFSQRRDESNMHPNYWSFPDFNDVEQEYKQLESDVKIAYIHWGVEFINYPSIEQQHYAHWLIDLGFDLIIGMHPHILQGYEIYKGKHIFYSLGNFVFNMAYLPTKYSIVVGVDIEHMEVSYRYVHIGEDYSPSLINETNVPEQFRLYNLNKLIGIEQNPETYIHKADKSLRLYRKAHHRAFIKNIYRYNMGVMFAIVVDFIKRKIYGN